MDDLERPAFHPYTLEQIEEDFHHVDKRYWGSLREMQVSATLSLAGFVVGGPGLPAPPKRPEHLKFLVGQYADSLFYAEAAKYPKPHENFRRWLEYLAIRIEARVIQQVNTLEASSRAKNLAYHGLAEEEMREAVREDLVRSVEKWCPNESSNSKPVKNPPAAKAPLSPSRKRLPGSVASVGAARKMEAYIEAKGLGMTEFANLVPTTDRTLRSFRRTGRVRRDIFEGIAKAMKTTKEQLLDK